MIFSIKIKTKVMSKEIKLRKTKITLAAICIAGILSFWILTEPLFNLYGFETLNTNQMDNIEKTLVLYDSNGTISNLPISNMIYVHIDEIPDHTIEAFLTIEDKRFFRHGGIDYYRIIAAAVKNFKEGNYAQGGSTITQQLIKNTHLSQDKTLMRKIKEIRLATALERKYTKKEILEMYLNIIYFGNSCYGLGSAAKMYFNKDVKSLNVAESASLAAIINNPSKNNPYKNRENLKKRTSLILKMMKRPDAFPTFADNQNLNHYGNFVVKEACEILGCKETDILHGDYEIYTNYNNKIQNTMKNVLKEHKRSEYNLQAVLIDNQSGKIIGHTFIGQGSAFLRRSPASTMKPLFSYAPAIEKKLIVPITPILDEQMQFGDYTPRNYMEIYRGWISAKTALAFSQNIPAVKLTDYCGLDYCKEFVANMGIKTDKEDGLAFALGGSHIGCTLKEITAAYTAFPNGGIFQECRYVKAIKKGGKLIYSARYEPRVVMKESTAYFINEMLTECATNGTAKKLYNPNFIVAAKTGTSGNKNGNTDVYCVAYNRDFTLGVWAGAAETVMPNSITGGELTAEIARKILFMSDINSTKAFMIPKNIVFVDIDAKELVQNHRVVRASTHTTKKDKIRASFPLDALPYFNY